MFPEGTPLNSEGDSSCNVRSFALANLNWSTGVFIELADFLKGTLFDRLFLFANEGF